MIVKNAIILGMRAFLFIFGIFTYFGLSGSAQAKMAVAELFTAQGCAYAEAAEELFVDVIKEPHDDLVLLSCHVTIYDRDDYKDPFSNEWCDKRHKAYRRVTGINGASGIPKVVVNGRFFDRATNKPLVESSISMARSLDEVQPIQVSVREGFVDLTLPKMRTDQGVEIWLISYKKQHLEKVSQGLFKKPKELLFVHPITKLRKLFLWDGRYINTEIPLNDMISADGYAVLAQNERDLKIIAAGKFER